MSIADKIKLALNQGKNIIFHGNINDLYYYKGFQNLKKLTSKILSEEKYVYEISFTYNFQYDISESFLFRNDDDPLFTEDAIWEQLKKYKQDKPSNSKRIIEIEQMETNDINDVHLKLLSKFLSDKYYKTALFIDSAEIIFGNLGENTLSTLELVEIFNLIAKSTPSSDENVKKIQKSCIVLFVNSTDDFPIKHFMENRKHWDIINIKNPSLQERRRYFQTNYKEVRNNNTLLENYSFITEGLSIHEIKLMMQNGENNDIKINDFSERANLFRNGKKENSPWSSIKQNEIYNYMDSKILGQNNAIEKVSDILLSSTVNLELSSFEKNINKPKGVLFLAGPTGVGKTETAKTIAEFVLKDSRLLKTFSMSGEFSEEHADQRLIGAPPGYIGYESGGELTNWVKEHPFSIILFDEIEKAHKKVWDIFLQILDEARLTDSKGETVFFNDTFIIFTSNIGGSSYNQDTDYSEIKSHYEKEVKKYFEEIKRPEIFGRIGMNNVITYDIARDEFIEKIFSNYLEGIKKDLEKQGITLECDIAEHQKICLSKCKQDNYGYRNVRNYIEELLNKVKKQHSLGHKKITI